MCQLLQFVKLHKLQDIMNKIIMNKGSLSVRRCNLSVLELCLNRGTADEDRLGRLCDWNEMEN